MEADSKEYSVIIEHVTAAEILFLSFFAEKGIKFLNESGVEVNELFKAIEILERVKNANMKTIKTNKEDS